MTEGPELFIIFLTQKGQALCDIFQHRAPVPSVSFFGKKRRFPLRYFAENIKSLWPGRELCGIIARMRFEKIRNYMFYIGRRLFVGAKFYGRKFAKWVLISITAGLCCGLVGAAFYLAVHFATGVREERHWLIFLLPAAGLVIVLLYRGLHLSGRGTNAMIDSIHTGEQIPLRLVPVIFVSTLLTHLCGGSAGREGAALQLGGSIGCKVSMLYHLDEKDRRIATLCGMSAVFAALFGTPLTAVIFALEVISVGVLYYAALVPCLIASLTAYGISISVGMIPSAYTVTAEPLSILMMIRVIVLAMICAAVSILFCESMHITAHLAGRLVKNQYLRAAVGGAVILLLTVLLRTDMYNGAGDAVIRTAIETGSAPAIGFLLKIVFTAITLGCGFRGGEIVPSFFIGACVGCTMGPLLGIPAGFAASIGLIAMFCGAFNSPLAAIVLSVELFGAPGLLYYAAASAIAYMLSGYFGIYESQKILYSKVRAEFIDRNAK